MTAPPVRITPEERSHPAIRNVARACLELARLQLRVERLATTLIEREPHIKASEFHGWPAYSLNGQPFLVIYQTQPVCHTTGHRTHSLRAVGGKPWQPQDERKPLAGWMVLPFGMPDERWLQWASRALDVAARSAC